jgi:DivIVA domain-containing protein
LTKTGKNNTIYGSKKDGYIMINDRLYLTPQDILEKEFKIDARGYRMQEVDKFLDMVIRDYTEFLHTIKKLEQDNINLIEDNKKLQAEIRNLKESITANEDERPQGTSNVDLLRRISSLEKIVYGKDE